MAEQSPERALDRRTLLKRGAIAGTAAVWVVPAVQVFSMTASSADTPSGSLPDPPGPPVVPVPPGNPNPPVPVPPGNPNPPVPVPPGNNDGRGKDAVQTVKPSKSKQAHGTDALSIESTGAGTDGLANTGPGIPIGEALIAGAGAVVVGAAALIAGKRRPLPTAPTDGE